jgi:hypothetical protein
MTAADMYNVVLLALCNWREAQNQPSATRIGQAWSVRNRVERPGFWDWGDSYSSVILKPLQYSSFNHDDPNAVKIPHDTDASWQQSLSIAQDVYQGISNDPTSGCTHYYDKSLDAHPPQWATNGKMEHVIDMGELRFFRPLIAMSA